jgi:anti-sigma factor RsiW
MSEHLSEAMLNSLADGEVSAEQMAGVLEHLAGCAACTKAALAQMMLKSAAARAGRRYALAEGVQARMVQTAARGSGVNKGAKSGGRSFGRAGWMAVAAVLLAMVSVGLLEQGLGRREDARGEEAALVTEVMDEHVAALAANGPPEVVSSDRHTVKPWFQGKIPFSFNLPEGLAADVTLDGANLTYLHHRPVAQLLYTIGKHRVSVFVQERDGATAKELKVEQAGFHVLGFETAELRVVGVSDVEEARLAGLMGAIQAAQGK